MDYVLTHHGILGMKWGRRRFQNKDGSLTAAGRKRYGDDSDDPKKAKESEKPKRKSVSEMSDDELRRAIQRARDEDTYRQLRPEPVSNGKKFVSALMGNVVLPAVQNAGRQQLQNLLNKVGDDAITKAFKDVEDPNSISALTKVRDKLKIQNEIKKLKNGPEEDTNWDNMLKKQQYEANKKKAERDAEYEEYDSKFKTEKKKRDYEDQKRKWDEEDSKRAEASKPKDEDKSSDDDTYPETNYSSETKNDYSAYTSSGQAAVSKYLVPTSTSSSSYKSTADKGRVYLDGMEIDMDYAWYKDLD